jgi:hypothetical protein
MQVEHRYVNGGTIRDRTRRCVSTCPCSREWPSHSSLASTSFHRYLTTNGADASTAPTLLGIWSTACSTHPNRRRCPCHGGRFRSHNRRRPTARLTSRANPPLHAGLRLIRKGTAVRHITRPGRGQRRHARPSRSASLTGSALFSFDRRSTTGTAHRGPLFTIQASYTLYEDRNVLEEHDRPPDGGRPTDTGRLKTDVDRLDLRVVL